MGFWDKFRKKEEVIVKPLPPQKQDPIRFIDYGTATQERTGGVTLKGANVWTSGGGGGSSQAPAPTPTTPAQATSQYAKEVAVLRQEAKAKGVSPEVYLTQQRSQLAQQIRAKALQEGRKIETPVQQRKYISELKQREQLQKEKQKEEQVKQDFFNKIAEKKMSG